MKHNFERYCKDYENIENYEKAKKDNFKGWHCHHRLETHTSDGERRTVDITQKELIALNMYYHRPASELIFLTIREHNAFKKGKKHTEEHKNKLSEAHKGKHLSEEHKNKLSEVQKGKPKSEEARRKMVEAKKGKHLSEETKKKIGEAKKGKKHSEETKKKIGEVNKGKHWYNNGKINIMSKECPPGFTPGVLKMN